MGEDVGAAAEAQAQAQAAQAAQAASWWSGAGGGDAETWRANLPVVAAVSDGTTLTVAGVALAVGPGATR